MQILHRGFGLAIACTLLSPAGHAAPARPVAAERAQTAYVPFDPPMDEPVEYRWEEIVENNGKTVMSWSVSSYRFEKAGGGYRLRVSPVSSGSNETDPDKLAVMKKLESLINIPYTLRLAADGEILELEDADKYWATIIAVLREHLEKAAKPEDAAASGVIKSVLGIYEKMPPEVRLALLTEAVQPLVEFGDTETKVGEPLSAVLETQSPFGGTLKQEVVVSLTKVADGAAHLTIRSNVPRSELDLLMKSFADRLGSGLPPGEADKMRQGLASLKNFRRETRADFRVSLNDGMLEEMRSTETIEVGETDKTSRKITTRSMKRSY